MNTEKTDNTLNPNWEQPQLEVLNINTTNNGEDDVWSEDTFVGWILGGGHS